MSLAGPVSANGNTDPAGAMLASHRPVSGVSIGIEVWTRERRYAECFAMSVVEDMTPIRRVAVPKV
jgi:hypothetical protein